MNTIFKTWKKATYLKGVFKLRDNSSTNWATPIGFPTVFTAYGKGITSGNWQSCTAINTPEYVIERYFDTVGQYKNDTMFQMWEYCKELKNVTWDDVVKDRDKVLTLINLANSELLKLKTL